MPKEDNESINRSRGISSSSLLYYGCLFVGSIPVCDGRAVRELELAIFRDDMLRVWRAPAEHYRELVAADGPFLEAAEFRAPGRMIADRLDLMGITPPRVLATLKRTLKKSRPFTGHDADAWSPQDWIDRLAATPETDEEFIDTRTPGKRGWLLQLLTSEHDWDIRYILRAVLLAFPDAEVSLDVTWRSQYRWAGLYARKFTGKNRAPGLLSLASEAQNIVRGEATTHSPIVVLTEGRTDSDFLSVALEILYPHLTDLVRFLDYERKPEGGASSVLRMARAFAAAGIANRVIAVLDNDTAAADEIRAFSRNQFPAYIRIMQYPDLELARSYPTFGPPTAEFPDKTIAMADVNGLAASVELYLGQDVLATQDGSLRPVQWKAFIAGMGRYQGEVTGKRDIHEAFRTKADAARRDPSVISQQDWNGMRLILDALLEPFWSGS